MIIRPRIPALAVALALGFSIACAPGQAPEAGRDAGPTNGDAGHRDAGPTPLGDAGPLDAGPDAGSTDAGLRDAGSTDAGSTDAGASDGGGLDGGCPLGDVAADAGNCINACLTCESSDDCDGGTCIVNGAGCSSCVGGPPQCTLEACRSSADCCGSAIVCVGPNDSPACGVCMAPRVECATSTDCDSGQVCQELPPGACVCSRQPSYLCEPACTATSCGAGSQCTDAGTCDPLPCDGGYACPSPLACDPAGSGADLHGCAPVPCSSDADCTVGLCVTGTCSAYPGTCQLALP